MILAFAAFVLIAAAAAVTVRVLVASYKPRHVRILFTVLIFLAAAGCLVIAVSVCVFISGAKAMPDKAEASVALRELSFFLKTQGASVLCGVCVLSVSHMISKSTKSAVLRTLLTAAWAMITVLWGTATSALSRLSDAGSPSCIDAAGIGAAALLFLPCALDLHRMYIKMNKERSAVDERKAKALARGEKRREKKRLSEHRRRLKNGDKTDVSR